ncbi:MAG: alpha/beta fold hydrolase [Chitinophagaceae bacterium]|nr:alpha/beta fold hydrolase [Rubrivivax sp.]
MQRRTVLSTAAGALAAAISAPVLAATPARKRSKATVVFIHGAWHGGWCWVPVTERLAAAGFASVAVDLPGHAVGSAFPAGYFDQPQDVAKLTTAASPLAALNADSYRSHVMAIVEGLVASGSGPVVLVGHSLGGVTLNTVGEAAPQLVRRLVYLTALNPVAKPAAGAYFTDPSMSTSKALPLFIGDPTKTGAIRFNHRSTDPAFRAAAKAAFYADVTDEQFTAVANLLTPDEPAAVFGGQAMVSASRWGRIARTYIRCTEDQAIPIAAQDQFIAEADALVPRNRYTVRTLRASHSPFLSRPAELARLIEEAASS